MGIRAILAALATAVLVGAGAYYIESASAGTYADFFSAFLFRIEPPSLLCTAAAWLSFIAGLMALATALAAFRDYYEEDYEYRRRAPKIWILIFAALCLAAFWFVLRCSGAATPPAPLPPADASSSLEEDLLGTEEIDAPAAVVAPLYDEPLEEEVVAEVDEPAPPPPVETIATGVQWPYMHPLVQLDKGMSAPAVERTLDALFPMNDPRGEVRALLCGKAWVAVAGASSEEGPRERNQRRARVRADMAAQKAESWLDAHEDDCVRPVILTIDLGQHVETGAPEDAAGAATGYQREVLIAAQARAYEAAPPMNRPAAAAQLRAFLASDVNRRALLGGRDYRRDPDVAGF